MQTFPSTARLSPRAYVQALLVAAGAVALALTAEVRIPLPFSPVPVTAQTLIVLALAAILGRRSALSVAAYLALAAWTRLAGPTGGYLLGFLLGAYIAGWLAEGSRGRPLRLLLALLLGQAAIYACGLLWLGHFLPTAALLPAGLYPFLLGDAFKLALAFLIALPLHRS